jgi:hypothetical protein
MEVIFVRSPYFIQVDEASQLESKVELFIWLKGESEPATATYTLSKKAASATQTKNIYNISNYVKEFINIINPVFVFSAIEENTDNWCYVKVKRYYSTTANNPSPTLLDTTTYVALNGYTNYLDGYNNSDDNEFIPFTVLNQAKTHKYSLDNPFYLNFYIDYVNDTDVYSVVYSDLNNANFITNEILNGDVETQYVFKVPITKNDIDYLEGNKVSIVKNETTLITYVFKTECENKYTPMLCSFINRFGGWDFITFFKAKIENWEVKNKEYQLLPDDVAYNILRGETKMFNYEAKQSVKINTGWVEESYNELIKDLMTSETILLDNNPVKLKTMTTDLKTSLQDKMINYQIDFEYNYNQINNVI